MADNFSNFFVFELNESFEQINQHSLNMDNDFVTSILGHPFDEKIFIGTKEGKLMRVLMSENFDSLKNIESLAMVSKSEINNLIFKDENTLVLTSIENSIKLVDTQQLITSRDFYFKALQPTAIDYNHYTQTILAGFA